MSWFLCLCGWAVAAWLLVRMRRWRETVADAEHELRGALTAMGLALERVEMGGVRALVGMQLRRAEAALADLSGERRPDATAGRSAQLFGNLIANAAEHGVGEVEVRSERHGDVVRLELRNRNRSAAGAARTAGGRGRGLRIAARAAKELGGELRTAIGEETTVARVELPTSAVAAHSASASPARSGNTSPARSGNTSPARSGSASPADLTRARAERAA